MLLSSLPDLDVYAGPFALGEAPVEKASADA